MHNNYTKRVLNHKGLGFYSDAHKFVYLAIPKTASGTIRHSFNIRSKYINVLKSEDKKRVGYKKFTIIREPIDRFISGYLEVFKRRESIDVIKPLLNLPEKQKLTKFIPKLEEIYFDVHVTPQTFFLDEDIEIDDYLLFDNLSKDFEELKTNYGFNEKLLHKNQSPKAKKNNIRNIIEKNPDLMKRVKKLYESDFELYNRIKDSKKLQ